MLEFDEARTLLVYSSSDRNVFMENYLICLIFLADMSCTLGKILPNNTVTSCNVRTVVVLQENMSNIYTLLQTCNTIQFASS